ncbi:hypothetical protein PIB30_032479 [Stylosanthes scabra]|uniref:Uncharacterized protein n=1 Tax=Stylosanthes scabra TaxID=79078 RepID=A0ABU6TE25_9FABA|nr:hypothetical protein [Stylosanthes scabra]
MCWKRLVLPTDCPSKLLRTGLTFCGPMEVLTRCRVAASQLHLNGWGFFRTFERLHAPPPGTGFLSFRAYQGKRLFDAFEESIQEFKWHYFKILPLPGSRPFWLDDEEKSFPWVYWNSEIRECRITTLDPLETLAFEFLQSLPVGLGKKSNFRCRWILDHNDAEVGAFLDNLLGDMERQSRYDRLLQKMAEVAGAGPRSVLPHVCPSLPASGESSYVPPVPPSVPSVPAKRKRKVPEVSAEEAALGPDSAWEHEVNPIDRAFPPDYNFRAALDAGLTQGPARELLSPLPPEQLLGIAQLLACKLTACLQVGVENSFAAKVRMEKELAAPLLNSKIKSLTQELELAEGERLSAVARMKEVEETAKVQAAELESCHAALEQERKRAELLAQSLAEKQTALGEAEAAADHWQGEWKSLAEETGDMVQETFEILMDQVRHLNPAIDYSMISLDTRWDPKARRIYNPKAEAQEQSEPIAEEQLETPAEDQPDPAVVVLPEAEGESGIPEESVEVAALGEGGECPT